jgi:hypothetical protein
MTELNDLTAIQNKLKAPKNQLNKFGGYKYRNQEDILESVKPLLKKHGCTQYISDKIILIGDRYYIEATVTFTDSKGISYSVTAYAREAENKKGMDESQITGSASSYARKYALNGLYAIDDTKDADSTNTHGNESENDDVPQGFNGSPSRQNDAPLREFDETDFADWNGKIYGANKNIIFIRRERIVLTPEAIEVFQNHAKYKPEPEEGFK